MLAKHYKPKWTAWRRLDVRKDVKRHKRRERRLWKQYMKTGSLRIFNAARRKLINWDFD